MQMSATSLTLFFPFYNDQNTIRYLTEKAIEVVEDAGIGDYEIVLVNDGSRDDTGKTADSLQKEHPGIVRAVHHRTNRGYGGALRTGFAEARKKWVFYTDGDAQYDLEDLKTFLRHLGETDVINGYKIRRADGLHRTVIGRLYHWTARTLFGIKMRDIDCDFRLIRKSVLDRFCLYSNSGVVCVELMKKVQMTGASMIELPVRHLPRRFGSSQFFRLGRILHVGFQMLGLLFALRLGLSSKHRIKEQEEARTETASAV
jgi:glycosyltransferase involved in cell wall biosynthesis